MKSGRDVALENVLLPEGRQTALCEADTRLFAPSSFLELKDKLAAAGRTSAWSCCGAEVNVSPSFSIFLNKGTTAVGIFILLLHSSGGPSLLGAQINQWQVFGGAARTPWTSCFAVRQPVMAPRLSSESLVFFVGVFFFRLDSHQFLRLKRWPSCLTLASLFPKDSPGQ